MQVGSWQRQKYQMEDRHVLHKYSMDTVSFTEEF